VFAPSRPDQEGRIAIVTDVGHGMRWTRRRRETSGAIADGEVVWSWRPDAGAKFSWDTIPRERRWQKSPVTGEITYKP
jgi:hypothetical protein